MQDENTDRQKTAHRKKRWYVRWWAWCLWALMVLILLLIALGCWGWVQRYALMEDWIVDTFAESGFDAELDITSVTRIGAQVKDIQIKRAGQDVLSISDLSVDYIWPDVRDKKVKHIELSGVMAHLNLDEAWKLEDWIVELLPESANDSSKNEDLFPENGIALKDATLNLISPVGAAKLYIDADIPSEQTFTSEITLAPSELSYGGYAAKGAGFATLEKTGPSLRIIGQTQTETLSNDNVDISHAHLQIDGTLNLDTHDYLGSISLESKDVTSELFASGPTHLSWDGKISPRGDLEATGTWVVTAEDALSPRPARAADVAEKLSLSSALSKVPVTEHYASHIQDTVFEFIMGSDVAGQGRLEYGPSGFTINPVGEFKVTSEENQISLRPRSDQDFYAFEKETALISAKMDARFVKPVGLNLTEINLKAASDNGLRLNGVQKFSAKLATQSNWNVNDAEGRPVRIGPLKSKFLYEADTAPRRISIDTALDYDGNLPGGYVEGLNLEGVLDTRLYDDRQELDFAPKPGSLVTLKSLETPTLWTGENISLTLPRTKNLLVRTDKKIVLGADLNAASFTLVHPATDIAPPQRLDLDAESMRLNGTNLPDGTKNWDVEFENVNYVSETLPGPGTLGSAPYATLTAKLAPEASPQISFNSPSVTAETPLVRFTDINMSLNGTPDAYTIEHNGGMIAVIGSEFAETAEAAGLANFPANGTVTLKDGVYKGQANLQVAKANDADVNVDYTYSGGMGTVDIDVPSILFEPQGLQPQTLIPAASGKIARVDGEARAKFNISFADRAITSSGGTLEIIDMSVGTAPGPITGLNTTMNFTSLLPIETSGTQTLTMDNFNPGFPLENGVVTFNFVSDGVNVESADWPIGNGSFSLDPFTWVYAADENRVTMRVKDVELGDFLNNLGNKKIDATGTVIGNFPIVVRGIEVLIEDGIIAVPDGGVIKYDPGPNSRTYSEEEAIDVLRQKRSNEYAALAQDALREFRYRELSASLNGPINGDVEIGLIFDGSNEKVLNRQPFRFDITVKGELFNIARSFNSNAHVKAEIIRQNGILPDGAVIGDN